jgi:uncharacterized protein YfdQ (DUF2303 family)
MSNSEASAGAAIVEKYFKPDLVELVAPDGMKSPSLLLPEGIEAHSIKELVDEWRTAPERREGTAQLADLESFIAHANRFKDADSALFAKPDRKGPSLTSVLDYHRQGGDGAPRFGRHRGVYPFPLSEEWRAWVAGNGQKMDQVAFAEFIEEHIIDVADPGSAGEQAKALAAAAELTFSSASTLLGLSRGLTIRQGLRVKNVSSLQSGEMSMHFDVENADEKGAPLKLPNAFLVKLRVFDRGAVYLIAARLRFRAAGGSVTWWYELYKHDVVFDDAFIEACTRARDETALPLFLGAPE